ncbi:hypothetical protein [Spirosoma areae]
MPFYFTDVESFDNDAMKEFAAHKVADFEPKQAIHIHVNECLSAVNGKGSNVCPKRDNLLRNCMGFGVGHIEQGGFKPGQIHVVSIGDTEMRSTPPSYCFSHRRFSALMSMH